MLILSRFRDESIVIDNHLIVTVCGIRDGKVRLGIVAPDTMAVNRLEIHDAIVRDGGDPSIVKPRHFRLGDQPPRRPA